MRNRTRQFGGCRPILSTIERDSRMRITDFRADLAQNRRMGRAMDKIAGFARGAVVSPSEARGYPRLTRMTCVAKAVSAPRVNPVRGDLWVASRPWKLSQTPLGVTCGQVGDGRAVHRSPLTGFGTSSARARCYKQVTPNGVWVRLQARRRSCVRCSGDTCI